jgi:hypothetical protein
LSFYKGRGIKLNEKLLNKAIDSTIKQNSPVFLNVTTSKIKHKSSNLLSRKAFKFYFHHVNFESKTLSSIFAL